MRLPLSLIDSAVTASRTPAVSETAGGLPVFCDWVQMSFPVDRVPPHMDRWVRCGTRRGVQDWERPAWTQLRDARTVRSWWVDTGERDEQGQPIMRHEVHEDRASDSTKVQVRHLPDQGLLKVSGNLGRWGKRDNVFGRSVYASAMTFLDHLARYDGVVPSAHPRLQRVDLTINIGFSGREDAYAWLTWSESVKLGRAMPRRYPTGCTWVTENWAGKVYDKLADLRRHGLTALADTLEADCGYMLRLELTARTDELAKHGLETLEVWKGMEGEKMGQVLFSEKFAPLLNGRGGAVVDDVTRALPLRLSNALASWRNGTDYPSAVADGRMSRATYYRLRRELLDSCGVDIALRCNVSALRIAPREIVPHAVTPPSWYREAA